MGVPPSKSRGGKESRRRMKPHRKSRAGWGNCKLRKVKCDEGKPMCKKCQVYGTFCNYDPQYSDLQPLAHGPSDIHILQPSLCLETPITLGITGGKSGSQQQLSPGFFNGRYEFSERDLELLHHFETNTIFTLGTGRNQEVYRNAFAKLTYSHSFLLHIVLTVALMHEQSLGIGLGVQQSTSMAFHWSQGAAMLNDKLSSSIEPSERDALWACAGMFGALAFSSIEAKTPEEAWPLKSSTSDLDWLKLCQGKREIWKITDPLRKDSVFHSIVPNFLTSPKSYSDLKLQKLPPELIELCKLDDSLLLDDNPYFAPAAFLSQIIEMDCNGQTVGTFLSFFGCIRQDYKQLLGQKDPCALLLFAYWYAKMCQYRQWWVWRRAFLECQAICKYLKLNHGDNDNILKAISLPEMICAAQSEIGVYP